MKADAFLRLYRVLEELLEEKYARSTRTAPSVVMEFMRDEDSLPFRDRLNLCREVRNLLTHNADLDGTPVVEPGDGIVKALEEIVEAIQSPLKALAFATPAEQLMIAHFDYFALRLMREMEQRGFSHIPVIEDGVIRGVFSISTVFSFMTFNPGTALDEHTRVQQFKRFLPVDKHITERFLFVGPETTYLDVKRAFERDVFKRKRVACLFVTENGESSGKLLGLITPWDVLGKVQGEGTLIENNKRKPVSQAQPQT